MVEEVIQNLRFDGLPMKADARHTAAGPEDHRMQMRLPCCALQMPWPSTSCQLGFRPRNLCMDHCEHGLVMFSDSAGREFLKEQRCVLAC